MEPQKFSQKQLIAIGSVFVVIILLGVGYWYVSQRQNEETQQANEETNQALDSLSESLITSETVISNPVEGKLPELNPVEKANPYKEYKNPFE
ncbi:MAG: hypothetical protein A3F24_02315 [Candidatus Colwellbacteria bacterium RIFCSPHIGHO2_12_FULL_44_17]|uniref:Uncharacterized protein n=2 Tax=Candidatus Colwelliibacteriota TaxID=1817904 RepID=A0A1G1Z7G5_9BACT|nr:MAG: hypothetical protein A3F24_02315 [Candidatus Colwellbacteria bacterium RIFCSPHIGHO2_12_FULL_44_17]OGY60573.1 MAG: hypothetical protein A3I31_02520 [Candidatus Colwellbacteria bacterium RIFCSPLOWO2_02_FULL_44_20b]